MMYSGMLVSNKVAKGYGRSVTVSPTATGLYKEVVEILRYIEHLR
jgi:hypothetical protein